MTMMLMVGMAQQMSTSGGGGPGPTRSSGSLDGGWGGEVYPMHHVLTL